MDLKKFTELANKHLTALESYKMDKNGNTKIQIFGIEELYKAINYTPCCKSDSEQLVLFSRFMSNNSKKAAYMTSTELLEEFKKQK